MRKDWLILGGVTTVAFLIVITPFLPERVRAPSVQALLGLQAANSVNILFVGDIMLDRSVAAHAEQVGDAKLFEGVQNLFLGHDLVVANLEGAITNNESVSRQDNSLLRFTFDPRLASLLTRVGVRAVSLANNHTLDFGREGYASTLAYLEEAGVAAFGSPLNDTRLAVATSINGARVCLVGYHQLFNPSTVSVVEKIQSVRPTCDHLVVFAHWGEEYTRDITDHQRAAAHAFVDAGADVVVGAHPHVVQPLEVYNNHAIFYSLGNFLFDQGFSPEVMRGLAVEIKFEESRTLFTLTPVNTYKEVAVADETTGQLVLKDLMTIDLPEAISKLIFETSTFDLIK